MYYLSGLIRGKCGTEAEVGKHTTGESFVLLDSTLTWQPMSLADVGVTFTLTYTPMRFPLPIVRQLLTFAGKNVKNWAPCHVTGETQTNGDIVMKWQRRCRVDNDWEDGVEVPMDAATEGYSISMVSKGMVVRTATVSNPTWTYTSADQATDGITDDVGLSAVVRQDGGIFGLGLPVETVIRLGAM
jgi:hypothetical protein